MTKVEYLPNELKQYATWACYQDDKKLVSGISGLQISARDFMSLGVYEDNVRYACDHEDRVVGLAFVLPPNYLCIDIDMNNPSICKEWVDALNTYAEYSKNNDSIHIILHASLKGDLKTNVEHGITILSKGQYVCLTGNLVVNQTQEIGHGLQDAFDNLYNKYFKGIAIQEEDYSFDRNLHGTHALTKEIVENRIYTLTEVNGAYNRLCQGYFADFSCNDKFEGIVNILQILIFFAEGDKELIHSIIMDKPIYDKELENVKKENGQTGFEILYGQANSMQKCIFEPNKKLSEDYVFDKDTCTISRFRTYPLDDLGNAQRFYDKYGEIVKYEVLGKRFYIYNEHLGKWVKDSDENLKTQTLVDTLIGDMRNELTSPRVANDTKLFREYNANIKHLSSHKGKNMCIEEIKHLNNIPCKLTDFDKDNYLLNTLDGVVNLRNGTLLEHNKNFMMSKSTNCHIDMKNEPKRFLQFINESMLGNQGKIKLLYEWFGYNLCGSTEEQCYFLFKGIGNDGKSVVVDVFHKCVGDYGLNMKPESVAEKKFSNGSAPTEDILRLRGARFISLPEPSQNMQLNESFIKQFTGEDIITARGLYAKESTEFYPTGKLTIVCNALPRMRGTSRGDSRRPKIVTWLNSVPEDLIDKRLKSKLYEEIPQILGWAVRGCIEWQSKGLEFPKEVKEAIKEYIEESNAVRTFVSTYITYNPRSRIGAGDLYVAFTKWANLAHEDIMSQTQFGNAIKDVFADLYPLVEKRRGEGGRIYFYGVDLLQIDTGSGITSRDAVEAYDFDKGEQNE